MEQHLHNFVVYPFNRSLCLRWAEAADRARCRGRPIGVADAWIAATVLEHNIPLITNNAGHYAGVEGLTVVAETTSRSRRPLPGEVSGPVQGGVLVTHVLRQELDLLRSPTSSHGEVSDLFTNPA
jgi:hypothetical protein